MLVDLFAVEAIHRWIESPIAPNSTVRKRPNPVRSIIPGLEGLSGQAVN